MIDPDELVSTAVIAWLLSRDEHLRPARVCITEYPPLQCAKERLHGLPRRTWSHGDRTAYEFGECEFSRIEGGNCYKVAYLWGPLIGGEYLLEWLPKYSRFAVTVLGVV